MGVGWEKGMRGKEVLWKRLYRIWQNKIKCMPSTIISPLPLELFSQNFHWFHWFECFQYISEISSKFILNHNAVSINRKNIDHTGNRQELMLAVRWRKRPSVLLAYRSYSISPPLQSIFFFIFIADTFDKLYTNKEESAINMKQFAQSLFKFSSGLHWRTEHEDEELWRDWDFLSAYNFRFNSRNCALTWFGNKNFDKILGASLKQHPIHFPLIRTSSQACTRDES